MIFITHAVVGGAIMKLVPGYPLAGLALALASHFVLDAIPHWHYKLNSYNYNEKEPLKSILHLNRDFLKDLVKIGLDGILGLAAAIIFLGGRMPFMVGLGAIIAVLPDFFQFLYLRIKQEPFTSFQKFHLWAHAKYENKKSSFVNALPQIIIMILAIVILG